MVPGRTERYSREMQIYRRLFGKRLKMARERLRFSMRDFAQLVEVTTATLSRWETGASFAKDDQLAKICAVLNVSQEYFLMSSDVEATFYATLVASLRQAHIQHDVDIELISKYRNEARELHKEVEQLRQEMAALRPQGT